MNWRQIPWIKLILTLLVAFAMWWVYTTKMEWYEAKEIKPFSKAAQNDSLLASSRLLKEFGYTSTRLSEVSGHTLSKVNYDEVIWIQHANAISDDEIKKNLRRWAHLGGHLIIGVSEPLSDVWVAELREAAIGVSPGVPPKYPLDLNTIITFRPIRAVDAITVEFKPGMNLEPLSPNHIQGVKRTFVNEAGERPYAILQTTHGVGIVTVLADPVLFNNTALQNKDNASMLLHLLASSPNSQVNYFTGVRSTPGLIGTLWQKFPVTILSLGTALAAWIFYAAARLGPVRQEAAPGRANLISHLRARGHFWRRRKNLNPLSEPVRQAALRELKRQYRLPSADDTLPSHVVKDIARSTGASEQRVRRVLSDQTYSHNELPNAAILLQKILNTHSSRSQKSTRFSP